MTKVFSGETLAVIQSQIDKLQRMENMARPAMSDFIMLADYKHQKLCDYFAEIQQCLSSLDADLSDEIDLKIAYERGQAILKEAFDVCISKRPMK